MPDQPQTPPPTASPPLHHWRWPLAAIVACLCGLAAFWLFLRTGKQTLDDSLDRAGKGFEKAAKAAVSIAEKFQQGTINTTFTAALPELTGTGMGNLDLAKARATETFTQSNNLTVLWGKLDLGTTVTEIRAPVTYRYHLKLSDPWQLEVSGQTCIVTAPRIRATLPPAIHTQNMEKRSQEGWGRFNAGEQMAELERNLTPTLIGYALDKRNINLAREECRKTVAEFVKNWLLKEDHWRTDRFSSIKVIFADEPEAKSEQMEPVLRLQ